MFILGLFIDCKLLMDYLMQFIAYDKYFNLYQCILSTTKLPLAVYKYVYGVNSEGNGELPQKFNFSIDIHC